MLCRLGLRTRLIDAVSTIDLLQMVKGGGIDPSFLVTHRAFSHSFDCYIPRMYISVC
jgi:hypothetical protein